MFKTASIPKLVYLLLVLFCFNACNEDTIEPQGEGSIAGMVLTSDTGEPVAAASISTSPATSAIVTDAQGSFTLEGVQEGDYSITAKKTGYKTETVSVAVKNNKQTSVTIVLEKTKEGNSAPNPPASPSPETDATNQPLTMTLRWLGRDADRSDTLHYDVLLYESGATQKKRLAEAIRDTSVVASGLMCNTTYFWQVVTTDSKGNMANGPVWSFTTAPLPEENRYLFVRATGGNYDIYTSNASESSIFRLTTGYNQELWPILNPLRDIIAYSSNESTEPQIYTMNRDGSDKRRITSIPVAGFHNPGIGFTWSPDGGKILYANYENLYTINRDGSGLKLIAKAPAGRHFRMMDWTSQGNKIVVQTIGSDINDSEIYVMNADGTNMKPLVGNLAGRVESPTFSIDGKAILYTRDMSGFENAEGRQLNSHIFMKSIDGASLVDLSAEKPAGTNDLYPRFSPDGSMVIFVNTSNDGLGVQEVWTVNIADVKKRTKLFANATMPDWK